MRESKWTPADRVAAQLQGIVDQLDTALHQGLEILAHEDPTWTAQLHGWAANELRTAVLARIGCCGWADQEGTADDAITSEVVRAAVLRAKRRVRCIKARKRNA